MSDDWRNGINVHSVEHTSGKQMFFRLTPAKVNPESSPIFLLLHGHGTTSRATYYAEKNWNVIAPVDNFGYKGKGSWWLGENGDGVTSELLVQVVSKSKILLGSSDGIILCIYGSSMGGYGAIVNAKKLNAKAVYANVPQIKLLGSTYSELGMKPNFEAVLGDNPGHIYNDLSEYIKTVNGDLPLFFLCENRFGQRNYLKEQAMSFIAALEKLGSNYHLEIVPTSGHNKNLGIREVKALFEKYIPELHGLIQPTS